MLMSGTAGQNAQSVRSGIAGIGGVYSPPPPPEREMSALGSLTKRLHAQVVAAQSIENEVGSVTRRLGGSVSIVGSEPLREGAADQVQPPRIDELNTLVDLLAQALGRTEAELHRLRGMVD